MQAQLNCTAVVGGVAIQAAIARTADGLVTVDPSLPAGKAGSLTTRTDNNTGEATLSNGHGIQTGDKVDVFWDGGLRYGMTVGTVAGNVVPIDGGLGDNLPSQGAAVVVTKQVQVKCMFDADDLVFIAVTCLNRCHVTFVDGSDVEVQEAEIAAGGFWNWVKDTGVEDPLTGSLLRKLKVSNGQSDVAATFKLEALYDSTP